MAIDEASLISEGTNELSEKGELVLPFTVPVAPIVPLSPVTDTGKTIATRVQEVTKTLEEIFPQFIAKFAAALVVIFWDVLTTSTETVGEIFGNIDAYRQRGAIAGLKKVTPTPLGVADAAKLVYRGLMGVPGFVEEAARNGISDDRARTFIAANRPLLAEPQLVAAIWRRILSRERGFAKIQEQGLFEEDINTVIDLGRNLIDTLSTLELWLREEVSNSEVGAKLSELGFTNEDIELLKVLAFRIPPIQDIIRFSVREAFNEAQVAALDLDAEYDAVKGRVEKFAKFQGFGLAPGESVAWPQFYWRAHWELPAPGQAFEMFHRTTDKSLDPASAPIGEIGGARRVIGEATLKNLLKALDIAPVWRDRFLEISFNPLTRVDIRRMFSLGILDLTGVRRAYYDTGYSPENAERLTQFTAAQEIEESLGTAKARMFSLFRDGIISEIELREFLASLQIPANIIDNIISAQRLVKEAEDLQDQVRAIQQMFFKHVISEVEALTLLGVMGLPGESVARMVALWVNQRKSRISRIGMPDLKKAFTQGVIDEDTFKRELEERGFPEDDAKILLDLTGDIASQGELT